MLWCRLFVIFISLTCVSLGESTNRILRKARRRSNLKPRIADECELGSPNLYWTMVGERTVASGQFLLPTPNLEIQREHLGWDDEDVTQFYSDAAQYFWEFVGVDVRSVPVDVSTGMWVVDGWAIQPFKMDWDMRIPYTSVHGVFPCPRPVLDTALVMVPTQEGLIYHGTLGGEEGLPAVLGDLVPFGMYIIDFDDKPDTAPSVWHYKARTQMRPNLHGQFLFDCEVYNDRWGLGRNEGRFDVMTTNEQGHPHISSRSVASFPARFDV